jgi:hypothetical protein
MPRRYYRIVRDNYAGYEVQVWRWWWPRWAMARIFPAFTNTHSTIEKAETYAHIHANRLVKDLGPL